MPTYEYIIKVDGDVYHRTYSSFEHNAVKSYCEVKKIKYKSEKIDIWK